MNGLMMQQPLLISSLLVHAERHHSDQEVVSRRVEGDIHRTTYRELASRSRRMAKALAQLGVKSGDRVGTLAWNGYPKGVLYSHRSTVLHTFAIALPDALNCSARDTILPVVPMFHVNAWGLPYAACMMGAKLVFPGPGLDGKSLYELFETERVTMSAGVPTVWQGLLAYVEANGLKFSTMRRTVIGGSACPPAMMKTFEEQYGVNVP